MNKTYLGDGVYAKFDGFNVILTTGGSPSNIIFLEPSVLLNLNLYVQRIEANVEAEPSLGNNAEPVRKISEDDWRKDDR